jgi:hypothetical protein
MMMGCSEDWFDINKDPNKLSELPSADVVIPAAQLAIANQLMGWDMGLAGAVWSQYVTQNHNASQFRAIDQYDETSFDNAYFGIFPGALNDLKAIKTSAEENENKGNLLLSESLSIYLWQIAVDTWGDVPYFEALDAENATPKFDDAEAIYADLETRINALLAMDFTGAEITPKFDFIFAGDINQWIRFANSVKLKLMLRQSETAGYSNAAVLAFVQSADFLQTSAQIDGGVWEDKEEKRHPMAEFEEGGAGYLSTNLIASRTLIDYLQVNADPRINSIFTAPSGGHKGAFQGDFSSEEDSDLNGTDDDQEEYSTFEFSNNLPIPFISAWEVEFYIAEVYARAGDNANAKAHYDAGVAASLAAHGIGSTITGVGEYAEWTNGTVEEGIKQIAMQKWVSYAKYQHWEAVLERNRTKYPAVNEIDIAKDRNDAHINFPTGDFTISVNGRLKLQGNLPSSPLYPNAVLTRNTNAPGQKANLGTKIWWDKKAGK